MKTNTPTLELDDNSLLPSELSIATLMRELHLQQRPNWLLRKLMNALEAKRQAKGMGWSRAWNKNGLNVFATHKIEMSQDIEYVTRARRLLASLLSDAPLEHRAFVSELLSDPACMSFTFYHNHEEAGIQHEGLTLSFGRKVATDLSKRDRVDLIMEDQRFDGRVDGLVDRVRAYVCPWSSYQYDKRTFELAVTAIAPSQQAEVQAAYVGGVAAYHEWKGDETRQWSHWSARYIDYFGPRSFIPRNTSFN